jgi:hypothetical protein
VPDYRHPKEAGIMSDEQKVVSDLIARCWRDDTLKQRFMSEPKRVLAEQGLELAPGCDVKVVEDTEKLAHIVLPLAPPKGELSDDELASVAGGSGFHIANAHIVAKKFTTSEAPH